MPKVLIIEPQMKRYRIPFFTKLHAALESNGIDLHVAYSAPVGTDVGKGDDCELSPPMGVKVKVYQLFGGRLLFQPLLRQVADANLVIVDQANKHILNSILVGLSRLKLKKVGFWGHGRNRQGRQTSLPERIKRRTVSWVDWWFAYTSGVREYVGSLGMQDHRITTVNNSIDTSELRRSLVGVTANELQGIRSMLCMDEKNLIGLYCGGLYPDKHIDFLIEAAALIHAKVPAFRLLVLGGGPEFSKVASAARKNPFIAAVGPCFGSKKASYFRLANVFLMPGLVGLAIVDAFTAGLPLITTNVPIHSPEIEYLEDGVNGFIVQPDLSVYADCVAHLLTSPDLLRRMSESATRSAEKYSIESMVQNFHTGIVQCLAEFGRQPANDRG
jgi:glycosyltransferase involved in cell wall biosynthesis